MKIKYNDIPVTPTSTYIKMILCPKCKNIKGS